MWTGTRVAIVAWLLLVAACGDDGASDADAGSRGATAGPDGGTDGSAGGPVMPIALDTERFPPGSCEPATVRLEGMLGGQPYQLSGTADDREQFAGRPFYFFDDGVFAFSGGTAPGAGNAIEGVIKLGDGWYCAGPGSTGAVNEGEHTVALAVHSLGACGDQPVEGEVFTCRGDQTQCTGESPETSPSAGSIEGIAWHDEGSGHSFVLGHGVVSFGSSVAFFSYYPPKTTGNGVVGAIITGPEHDRAVYCFGAGSTVDFGGLDGPDLFHFTSLSKLRSCPKGEASDVLHGCFE